MGHTRIVYAYPADERVTPFAQARLAGVRDACAQLGPAPPDVRRVGFSAESAAAAIRAWGGCETSPTAICADNDELALALLAAAHDEGLRVPDDLAVIGVEDIPAAALVRPALTTIALDNRPRAELIA